VAGAKEAWSLFTLNRVRDSASLSTALYVLRFYNASLHCMHPVSLIKLCVKICLYNKLYENGTTDIFFTLISCVRVYYTDGSCYLKKKNLF
jgi:hypothetical protein